MSYEERIELYKSIEKNRNRPLVSYVTSSRPFAGAQMGSDVIPEFTKQLNCIPKEHKEVDFLIASDGGDPTVSWRIISMLRERFSKIGVILPFAAYSAATLLALGCNELIMHPFANLGPVDPQLRSKRKNGAQDEIVSFGSEDLRSYFDYLKNDVGISDQEQLQKSFELVCQEIGAIPIGAAKRGAQLSLSMGEKLLSLHMSDSNKVKTIASALNTSFYHHGYPLGRKEAKNIGLPIVEPDPELESLMWQVWENFENEMQSNKPFNPYELIFQNAEVADAFSHVYQVQIPGGLPPQLAEQAFQQILQQIQPIRVPTVPYELLQAALESSRCKSQYRTKGQLSAIRNVDMSIQVAISPISQCWS